MKVWVVQVPDGEFLSIHSTKESAEQEVKRLFEDLCTDLPIFKNNHVERFYIISESEMVE